MEPSDIVMGYEVWVGVGEAVGGREGSEAGEGLEVKERLITKRHAGKFL